MTNLKQNVTGLSSTKAMELQEQFGKNELTTQKKESFLRKAFHIICEPMFLLLLVASSIYFLLGELRDASIMLIFVVGIISIDIIQEWKTDKTLNALKDLSAPHIIVLRDEIEQQIMSSDLVPNDIMMIHEGVKIPADGFIIKCNDLCIDESSLTGEAEGVWKSDCYHDQSDNYWRNDYCYAGTLVIQGNATILVDKIGSETEYGKIGIDVVSAETTQTSLQKQTRGLVKLCATIAVVLFLLVTLLTYLNIPDHLLIDRIVESLLAGIALAMAMIPEDFPVILTVFLSMGAWRLAKKKALVRKQSAIETLGAISVLCVDKTGTITMNKMTVQTTWSLDKDENMLCETMGLGCETDAYDPMEKAMLAYCGKKGITKDHIFSGQFLYEYPFTHDLKMMGHVWEHENQIIIAVKGSPEQVLTLCHLNNKDHQDIESQILKMSQDGLRVIAIANKILKQKEDIPKDITDCSLEFCGLIGLIDPPRENIKEDIQHCLNAGIRIVMITGDNGITASAIAKKMGMPNTDNIMTGDIINQMDDNQLREAIKNVSIFSRVIPEHKMRIVKAFKENNDIVAMTGDGVNDAPALKNADIGIAMGKRGSEVSREAADLILLDDNFTTIVEAIKDGRRIYDNIRKAIGYVFTVHLPVALISLFTPLLKILPSATFLLPIHIVLLHLVISPTCSIVLERQPAEKNIMHRKPRNSQEKLVNSQMLFKSLIQGIIIFVASFVTYLYVMDGEVSNAALARTMGIGILMLSNLFLVQVNSSEYDYAFCSIKKLIKDKVMWISSIGTIVALFIVLYTPLNIVLKLMPLTPIQLIIVIVIAFISVYWYEIVKIIKKKRSK
ncbi:MAG: cation-translocating P-type ATPase [Coprobacillus sp.]